MKKYRLFEPTTGQVNDNFRDLMITFWMKEGFTRAVAEACYGGPGFDELCDRLIGSVLLFNPDLGYSDPAINGTYCFESIDHNFVIPVNIIDWKDE